MEKENLRVRVEYKDRNLTPLYTKEYTLVEYTQNIERAIVSTINDVEHAFYELSGGKRKEEWPEEVLNKFNLIKHRLLDHAGDIRRLPENLMGVNKKEG